MMTKNIWNFSFFSVKFKWWFKFLEKALILFERVTSIKNLPISKVKSFLKSNFKVKYAKQCLHKTIKSGTLTQLTCFIFLLKLIEMLWTSKKCQTIGVARELGWVRTKNLLVQINPDKIFATNWSNPVELDKKKKFGICFSVFMNCYWQNLSS